MAPASADVVEDASLDVRLRSPAALRSAYGAIGGLAAAAGGFVAASTLTEAREPSASMTLRVPAADLALVTGRISGMGRVTAQTMSGQDVSGQVVDLAVEITNLTSEEAAVRRLLADAGSVSSILTVQQQLFTLQDEIQQLAAQSNSLHDRIRYATVTVALLTVTGPVPVKHRMTTLARVAHLAAAHTVALVRGVLLAVGWSAPGLVLLALLGAVGAVVRHRRGTPAPETAASRPAP